MRILLLERDQAEIQGIEWYLKNYFSSGMQFSGLTDVMELERMLNSFEPTILMLDVALVTVHVEKLLKNRLLHIICFTAQPFFQHAMKAISLQAKQLFVKPIPLEQLKSTLMTLPTPESTISFANQTQTDAQMYVDLFLNSPEIIHSTQSKFILIEPSNFDANLQLYHWLIQSPIFSELTAFPLQKRILCLISGQEQAQFGKNLRLVIQEWHMMTGEFLNIAIYDGMDATLRDMYTEAKQVLTQRFYKGYEHVFLTSESISLSHLDPLLTPEQQQLWITSLEEGNLSAVKQFLYKLSEPNRFYPQEEVRIHLTSVLAQIRRFMLKHHLQQQVKVEHHYRQLFSLILDEPILYTIVQEMIFFTQSVLTFAKSARMQQLTDYSELAIEQIEKLYSNSSLSLLLVAEKLRITPNYLSQLFSKRQGVTFKRYLQQYRVQQAEKMLLETDYPISEIAEMNGFVDSNYFIKVFREHTVLTPYKYRKTYQL
ncbi:DNA-binding response regulator [Solibacillus sp. R5-41]|uniref:response regulator transcription factor n=1 Tax=Solibacillus sp. R5-41 TaxID=2048654 RepID=UPI000C125BF6|nr:response regulator transcription factor [Solibacillus sp. R5-41]ATP38750.1 DNA-binding response regulator [Solibacillus sp. R5-41]